MHTIGMFQLLALLKSKLFEEEPVILFNYFGMHKRCMELLRLIKAKEHHKFVQYFTESYMPDDSLIGNIVLLIHHIARSSAVALRQRGMDRSGTPSYSRMIKSCGEVMQQYLLKNGDIACKELRVFCKNKGFQEQVESGYEKEAEEDSAFWYALEEVLGSITMASLMTGIRMT